MGQKTKRHPTNHCEDYQGELEQKKRRLTLTEDFDPQPVDCRGTAASLLFTIVMQVTLLSLLGDLPLT